MISQYRWKDSWSECQLEFYGRPFVAIDPGSKGAALWVPSGKLEEASCYSLARPQDLSMLAEGCLAARRAGASPVLVMEDQYVGGNAGTSIKLAQSAGLIAGLLRPLEVVWVMPKEWQSQILPGIKGRDALKKAALSVAEELPGEKPKWNKAQLEGWHDAKCIAQWWLWSSEPV